MLFMPLHSHLLSFVKGAFQHYSFRSPPPPLISTINPWHVAVATDASEVLTLIRILQVEPYSFNLNNCSSNCKFINFLTRFRWSTTTTYCSIAQWDSCFILKNKKGSQKSKHINANFQPDLCQHASSLLLIQTAFHQESCFSSHIY